MRSENELRAWAYQAKKHWQQWQPNRYRRLRLEKTLEQEALAAARLTDMEMTTLRQAGYAEHEAWEAARELFLFPPPERRGGGKANADPDNSGLSLVMAATRLLGASDQEE